MSCGSNINHCDPIAMPRVPRDEKGCPIGRVQCQQELGLDAATSVAAGATATLTFTPYREFTPLSLWNNTVVPATGLAAGGVVITSVAIGANDMTKGEISGDLYLPTIDRGHDVHWDTFDPNTPLRMGVRNDGAATSDVNFVIKGAAYRR